MHKYNKHILILIAIVPLIMIIVWFLYQIRAPHTFVSENVPITVPSGSPGRNDMITAIAHELYWGDLVKNERVTSLIIYIFTFNRRKPFEAGTYYIQRGINVFKVVQQLHSGPNKNE